MSIADHPVFHGAFGAVVSALVGAGAAIGGLYLTFQFQEKQVVNSAQYDLLRDQAQRDRDELKELKNTIQAMSQEKKAAETVDVSVRELREENQTLKLELAAVRERSEQTRVVGISAKSSTEDSGSGPQTTKASIPVKAESPITSSDSSVRRNYTLQLGEVNRTPDGTSILLDVIHGTWDGKLEAQYLINGKKTPKASSGQWLRVGNDRAFPCHFEIMTIEGDAKVKSTQVSRLQYVCKPS